MGTTGMVSPQIWNISSNLCKACVNGFYTECTCDDDQEGSKLYKDLSNDSLDQCPVTFLKSKKQERHSSDGDYLFDDEFQIESEFRPLPPSTTDWDIIDSVLEDELHMPDDETDAGNNSSVSRCLSQSFNMQMVFVDSEESDKDSTPDVEVYYEDELRHNCNSSQGDLSLEIERNIDSRDSGYLTADVLDVNIEHVTDNLKRKTSLEPVEASARVLASLKLHEDHEIKRHQKEVQKRIKEDTYRSEIHRKNVEELRQMKETLELRIAQINMELVDELQCRDELNSHHEALLLEADDLKDSCYYQTNMLVPCKETSRKETKRKSFWRK